jgi:LAS superfamily LD-carboxypeptidase LdcB
MKLSPGRLLLPSLCLAALLFLNGPAAAQTLELTDMVVNNVHGEIWLRFGIKANHADGIAQVLRDGGEVELRASASVLRRRSAWWDKTITGGTFVSQLDINPLTEEYIAQRQLGEIKDKRLDRLIESAWSDIGISLGSWSGLRSGSEYKIVLTVELKRVDVPIWVRRSLFFWSWDVAPKNVYELSFSF